MENEQAIILDSANNVFVGPDGYFKIVIDQFDGQTVKAWHIEDASGNKTGNLAERAKGKHIDVLVNASNRTVWHFGNRVATTLIAELEAKKAALEAGKAAKPSAPVGIKVFIDGKEQIYSPGPVIINGTTMVPLRGVFEALGAKVDWNNDTQTITATKGAVTIVLKIGSSVATKNGAPVPLAQAAQIMKERTMVPARFVSEALGAVVNWDPATQTVTITTK